LGGSIFHIGVNPNVVDVRNDYMLKMFKQAKDESWKENVQLINIYDDISSLGVWDGKKFVYLGPRRSQTLTWLSDFIDKYLFGMFSLLFYI
jgi:hypothetical protein